MSDIKELIRQEIDRLENMDYPCDTSEQATGFYNALDCLSDFIDSLPEDKPSEDLEEAVFKELETTKEEYLAKSMDKVHLEMEIATYLQDWEDDDEIGLHLSTDEGCMPIELEDVRDLARHFAEWGAKHKDSLHISETCKENADSFNDMEEIYDKEALQNGLEQIENMTVKEIRRGLPEGYGFFISGDSSWAILKADKAKRDIL